MIQKHNRHISFSLYIAALAVSDTAALISGNLKYTLLLSKTCSCLYFNSLYFNSLVKTDPRGLEWRPPLLGFLKILFIGFQFALNITCYPFCMEPS